MPTSPMTRRRRTWRDAVRVAVLVALGVGMGTRLDAQERRDERWEADPDVREAALRRLWGDPRVDAVGLVRAATRAGLRVSQQDVNTWRSLGPFGAMTSGFFGSAPNAEGGRVRAAAFHPTNPLIMYVASATGGVWRTQNGGVSWTPLTDNACTLDNGTIAIDPVNPQLVYVGTGEINRSPGCGILRSVDGGSSWTEINGGGVLAPLTGLGNGGFRLRIDRATAGTTNATVLHYAASNGFHRSTNSGTTWTTRLTGLTTDVVQDTGSLWWAANLGTARGLYRSTDNGATWTLVQAFRSTVQRVGLAVTPAAPGRVWMAEVVSGRMDALRVYDQRTGISTDLTAQGIYGGNTRLDFAAQSTYNLVLEVDPTNADVVYLGGTRLYRSRDGGQTFGIFAYDLHVDWHAFVFAPSDPNIVLAGNDGGVFLSTDRGNSWTSRNTDIVTTQFYAGLAIHPTLPNVVAGGLQDNSSLWTFGSPFWTMTGPSGDGMANAWNEQNPSVFWSSSYGAGALYRSSWSALTGLNTRYTGFDPPAGQRKNFFTSVVVDPSNGSTVYTATDRVWRTTNDGATWAAISGDLTRGTSDITSVAVSRADPRVLWVGTGDGNVQVSSDAGTTWTLATTATPGRSVVEVVPDPTNARRAVLVLGGNTGARLFVTTDLGATWTSITAGLPDLALSSAVIIPGTSRLFVGATVGVYASNDNGTSWALSMVGLPNVRITDLQFQASTGILYAGTYGRGVWATTLITGTGVLRGDVDRNGVVNAFDAVLVQQALTGARPSNTQPPLPNGDANCNGVLDSGDVLAILRFSVGTTNSCAGTVK